MWDTGGMLRAGEYVFFYGKVYENRELGTGILYNTEQYQELRQGLLVIYSAESLLV